MGVGVAEEEAIEYSAGRKPRNSSHLTSRFGALSSNALMGIAGKFAGRSTEVVSFPRKRNPAKTFSTALAFDQRVDARLGEHEANGHRPTTPYGLAGAIICQNGGQLWVTHIKFDLFFWISFSASHLRCQEDRNSSGPPFHYTFQGEQ